MPRKTKTYVIEDEKASEIRIDYVPEPTLYSFHESDALVRGIMGPMGSGSSSALMVEMLKKAIAQKPLTRGRYKGERATRWAVVRDTYPLLRDTTLSDFLDWVPIRQTEIYGSKITQSPPYRATLILPMPDGHRVNAEFTFLAMSDAEDVEKLRSRAVTGVCFNEACPGIRRDHLKMAVGRAGRFPHPQDGGPSWRGVIMDTNAPDIESWWYQMFEIDKPERYECFKQPPAVLHIPGKDKNDPGTYVPNIGQGPYPMAENVQHVDCGFEYYMRQIPGNSDAWIRVFLMNQYGTIARGQPVYPMFQDCHWTSKDIPPMRGLPLIIGCDFGRTPCFVFCQVTPRGQLRIIDEVTSGYKESTAPMRMGIRTLARDYMRPHLRNYYGGMNALIVADPMGRHADEITDEMTCINELQRLGFNAIPARTQSLEARIGAVERFLTTMIDGDPGLICSQKAKATLSGFLGGYHYADKRGASEGETRAQPEQNRCAHPHSALQYATMHIEGGSTHLSGSGGGAGLQAARKVVRKPRLAW